MLTEKFYFINHILDKPIFGLYFNIASFIILAVILVFCISRFRSDQEKIKRIFLYSLFLLFAIFFARWIFIEGDWLIKNYKKFAGKSLSERRQIVMADKALLGEDYFEMLNYAKSNLAGKRVAFLSFSPYESLFARYYLYPEITLVNNEEMEYLIIYNADLKNNSLALEKNFGQGKNIFKIK